MAEDFALSAPTPPVALVGPHDGSMSEALRQAFKQALAGDFAALDRIELDFLNLLVRIGELKLRHADGTAHSWSCPYLRGDLEGERAPFVTQILRHAGPAGRQALEWQLLVKCRRCDGKLRHLDCRVCEGKWYIDHFGEHEVLVSDLDGVLL